MKHSKYNKTSKQKGATRVVFTPSRTTSIERLLLREERVGTPPYERTYGLREQATAPTKVRSY